MLAVDGTLVLAVDGTLVLAVDGTLALEVKGTLELAVDSVESCFDRDLLVLRDSVGFSDTLLQDMAGMAVVDLFGITSLLTLS